MEFIIKLFVLFSFIIFIALFLGNRLNEFLNYEIIIAGIIIGAYLFTKIIEL